MGRRAGCPLPKNPTPALGPAGSAFRFFFIYNSNPDYDVGEYDKVLKILVKWCFSCLMSMSAMIMNCR